MPHIDITIISRRNDTAKKEIAVKVQQFLAKELKYTKFGSSDLNMSRICMGCMGFGEVGNGQYS